MPVEHPLTDLDADLRALLSVQPSAGFAPRVRMRVAGERMAPRWAWMPLSLGGLAAAAAVLVAVAVSTPAVAPPPVAPAPPLAALGAPALPFHPAPTWPTAAPRSVPRRRGPAPGVPAVAVPRPPEVIVDPRQRAAVDALIALTNEGTVLTFASAPPPEATDIVVEPLTVPLLTVDPPAKPAGAERSDS